MTPRRYLAITAVRAATALRRDQGVERDSPIKVVEAAIQCGVDIWYQPLRSVDGLYIHGSPARILISSLRPPGRQSYTCAHELGHHVFHHGNRLEAALEGATPHIQSREEYLADVFAAHLLMPRRAVHAAFAARGWIPESSSPIEIYTIASWLGVGYTTLVHQLESGLRILDSRRARALLRWTPERIRRTLVGGELSKAHLLVVDRHWMAQPVDMSVGDLVLLPRVFAVPDKLKHVTRLNRHGVILRAVAAGIARLVGEPEPDDLLVRIAPTRYAGRAVYRHMAEVGDAQG